MYVHDNVLRRAIQDVLLPYFTSVLKNTQSIYRASIMTHPVPCNRKSPSLDLVAPSANIRHQDWHWDKFPKQSSIWKEYIDQHNFNVTNTLNPGTREIVKGIVFLNALPMMSKATHAHCDPTKDCLHYCLPGPLDAVVGLLFATLRVLIEMSYSPLV